MPFSGLDYLRPSLLAIRLSIQHQHSNMLQMHFGLMVIHQQQIHQHTALMTMDTENLQIYNLLIEIHNACRTMHETLITYLSGIYGMPITITWNSGTFL